MSCALNWVSNGWEYTKEYVLANMGYPTISVEITEKQLEICIRQSLEKWFEYRTPKLKYYYFTLTPGQDTYDIPAEALHQTEQGIKIKQVVYRPNNMEQFQYFFQYTLYNYKPISVANIYMLFSNLEAFQFITGQMISWEIVNGNQIRIAPIPPEQTQGAVIYSANDEETELDLNPWIWKYTLAQAKIIVGRVRSKFSIPTPTGSEQQLAGADLIAEGKEEIKILEEKLMATQEPMPFIVG